MSKGLKIFLKIWMFLGFAFLYIPILVIIIMSFNGTAYGMFPFKFTLEWYPYLFTKSELLPAAVLSLKFSLTVAVSAIIVGTMAAFGMQSMPERFRKGLNSAFQLPITIPWLVQGVSLLLILNLLGIGRSYFGMFCGNVICVLPYVVMLVLGRFAMADRTPEAAARLLGAGPVRVFFDITFPMIVPGVLAGGMMAFIVCFNSFCIQYYLAPFGVRTLPVEVFTLIKTGYKADLNALAALMIMISLAVILLLNRMGYSGTSLFAAGTKKGKMHHD